MTPAPSLSDLIASVEADAASDAPLDQLAAASSTTADLAQTTDDLLAHFVDRCRRAGHSWTEISQSLGVTKQAAHKRFSISFDTDDLQRFTPRARASVDAAADAARALGHTWTGTEHLLLGLYHDAQAIAPVLLAAAGITRDDVASTVLERFPATSESVTDAPFTPKAADSLVAALQEALGLGHNYIGTEHLLLGLYRHPDGLAAETLTARGFGYDDAKAKVIEALAGITKT